MVLYMSQWWTGHHLFQMPQSDLWITRQWREGGQFFVPCLPLHWEKNHPVLHMFYYLPLCLTYYFFWYGRDSMKTRIAVSLWPGLGPYVLLAALSRLQHRMYSPMELLSFTSSSQVLIPQQAQSKSWIWSSETTTRMVEHITLQNPFFVWIMKMAVMLTRPPWKQLQLVFDSELIFSCWLYI